MKKIAIITLLICMAGAGGYFFLGKRFGAEAVAPERGLNINIPGEIVSDDEIKTLSEAGSLPDIEEIPSDAIAGHHTSNVGTVPLKQGGGEKSAAVDSDAENAAQRLLEKAGGREGEGKLKILRECWTRYGETLAGGRAGADYGGALYAAAVLKSPDRSRWEDIRDAYSAALRSRALPEQRETEIVERLMKLNAWLFSPASNMKIPASKIHEVDYGESLWVIAKKYGVTHTMIQRLNGIRNPGALLVGQRLRIFSPKSVEIVVEKSSLHLTLYYDGRFVRRFPVGIGRDGNTPAGRFRITTRDVEPYWYYDGKRIPFGDPRNILGTRWLGFDPRDSGAGLGIHGSRNGEGVGARESMGCVRMRNADVEELFDLAPLGTTVIILD